MLSFLTGFHIAFTAMFLGLSQNANIASIMAKVPYTMNFAFSLFMFIEFTKPEVF